MYLGKVVVGTGEEKKRKRIRRRKRRGEKEEKEIKEKGKIAQMRSTNQRHRCFLRLKTRCYLSQSIPGELKIF